MRHFRSLLTESKNLEVFEVIRLLNGFISDKGVTANVEKKDNFFNVYISSYVNSKAKQELSESALLEYFKSLGVAEEADIVKTQYGYKIVMGPDIHDAKLMEAYANEEEDIYECCICEGVFNGEGKNPWPISEDINDRACESCKDKYVIPTRLEQLRKIGKLQEATEDEEQEIEHEASNTVLDKRYVWVFAVLNEHGEYIKEHIPYIQDAIEVLLDNDATFLIAFPYVDPKPEDETVGLVFADSPGPVVLYNREEARLSKSELQKGAPDGNSDELGSAVADQMNREQELSQAEESANRSTSITIKFDKEKFKKDDSMYRMFDEDFDRFANEITEASLELAEVKLDDLSWELKEDVLESSELPYDEAKEIVNRLKRDFQVEATISLTNDKEPTDGEDYYLTANFKAPFYEGVSDDEDVMKYYKNYFKKVKQLVKESEGLLANFYYEGSNEADFYSNLLTESEAKKIASHFDDDKVEIEIKKVEV